MTPEEEKKQESQKEQPKNTAVATIEKNITDQVLKKVKAFEQEKSIKLPQDYSPENALKSAYLVLQETKDTKGGMVLQTCTKDSIATALLDMVVQGLSVAKKQCYFIAYGNKLTLMRSYFGTVALARRIGSISEEPVANIIYKGDDFVFQVNPQTGRKEIVKHETKLENIGKEILGAYCLLSLPNGRHHLEIMSMQQIRAAWSQSATNGNSPAHKKFEDQMAMKTVISRACKMFINSSSDSYLYDGTRDESDIDTAKEQRDAQREDDGVLDVGFEEVSSEQPEQENPAPEEPAAEVKPNGPGF